MTRQAYGSGSMTAPGPGVWRLRVMVDGKQRQETFRGTEAADAQAPSEDLAPREARTASVTPTLQWPCLRRPTDKVAGAHQGPGSCTKDDRRKPSRNRIQDSSSARSHRRSKAHS